ncbi:MAG: BTAD domain-containing putative transcriptional regulator [Alphaproteobacteria bacterium]|nr:BTAD domain-containing putative transcriptional regulator [Alphaproteobacteria bacterium]
MTPRIRKSRAVIAVLALASPKPVLRDRFAALLWSQRDRDQGRASLRQCVHEMQTLFAPSAGHLLIAERNHIAMDKQYFLTDARLGMITAQPYLAELDGLDPAFDRWLLAERQRFARAAIAVAEGDLLRHTGNDIDAATSIALAEHLLAIDAVNESGWRVLIAAHLARGARAAAMEAYQACVATLAERTGIAPSAETQALLSTQHTPPAPRQAAARASRPDRGVRLGVRPFRSLDGPANAPLSLGLAEEITTALARFRWFFLISNPSHAGISTVHGADDQNWREIGLDFLLDGTIQRSGDHVRISARLLDLNGGPELIWASRFDRTTTDIFAIQDEIAAECVAQIDPAIMLREGERVARSPHANSAYAMTMTAIPAIYRLDEAPFRAAGELLASAIQIDPDYAPAHSWFACWQLFHVGQNWAVDPAAAMQLAGLHANRAIALDPSDARAFTIAGHVRAFLDHRIDEAMRLHERALSLNPNLPLAWGFAALADCYAGHPEQAISRVRHARRLSPFDPHAFFFDMALMLAQLLTGDFEGAVATGRQSLSLNPTLTSTYKVALAALGHLGLEAEIAPLRARLLELEPGFSIAASLARTPLQPDDRARYAEGLRLAGLPE